MSLENQALTFALDFDGTYTNAPELFTAFCKNARALGYKVYVVTMRYHSECANIPDILKENVDGIYATSRQAKGQFMKDIGIPIHIWIDDNPAAVEKSAAQIWGTASPEGQVVDVDHAPTAKVD